MSKLFGNIASDPKTQRKALESRYSSARNNLLLMIIFSAVNILMLATNSSIYFLFSATIPYVIVDLAMFYCGMYPDELYTGELEGMVFADKSFFAIMLVVALLILAIYLLCWFFSKKKATLLTVAVAMFSLDTVILVLLYGLSSFVDLAFHIWVIITLAMGLNAHSKLKKLPAEEVMIEGEFTELPADEETQDGDACPETVIEEAKSDIEVSKSEENKEDI